MGFLLGHHTYLHISPGSGQFHLIPGPNLAEQFLGSCISLEGGEKERETHMRLGSLCEFSSKHSPLAHSLHKNSSYIAAQKTCQPTFPDQVPLFQPLGALIKLNNKIKAELLKIFLNYPRLVITFNQQPLIHIAHKDFLVYNSYSSPQPIGGTGCPNCKGYNRNSTPAFTFLQVEIISNTICASNTLQKIL